jgi:GT2 family glycosyltransferase
LDYPRAQFEVLVVSDGPDPATEERVLGHAGEIPVRLLTQEHGGPAKARNTGAAAASGEFLVFLDDDCTPAPDWLDQWELHARKNPDGAAVGGTRNALTENLYACASQLLLEFVLEYFNAGVAGRPPFLASNNLCVPAERFRSLGGFCANFPLAAAEDRDFSDRWYARGWPLGQAPSALVLHAHDLTLAEFCRQHWNYGRGAFRLRQQRNDREQASRVEPFRFYADLLRLPWRGERVGGAVALSALLILSQAANVAGFLREGLSGMRR